MSKRANIWATVAAYVVTTAVLACLTVRLWKSARATPRAPWNLVTSTLTQTATATSTATDDVIASEGKHP